MAKTAAECDTYLATLDNTFLALFNGDPLGAGTELPTISGYARQAITWGAPTNASGATRQRANTNIMTFGPFTGAAGNATHFAIMSLVSGGVMRRVGALTQAINNITTGRLEAAAGAFVAKES